MKIRSKKWICAVCLYSLLSVLSVVISFAFTTEKVIAKKYTIDKIPLFFPSTNQNFPNYFQFYNGFYLSTYDPISKSDLNDRAKFDVYSFKTSTSNSSFCSPLSPLNQTYYNLPYFEASSSGLRKFYWNFTGLDSSTLDRWSSIYYDPLCSRLDLSDSSGHDLVSWGNLTPPASWSSISPFRSKYNAFFLNSQGRTDTGFIYNSYFDVVDSLFFKNTNQTVDSITISDLHIPFGNGLANDSVSYSNSQSLAFSGSIDLLPLDSSQHIDLSSSTSVSMRTYYGSHWVDYPCSFTLSDDDEFNDDGTLDFTRNVLFYYCQFNTPSLTAPPAGVQSSEYFDPTTSFPWFRLDFHFEYGSGETAVTNFYFNHPNTLITNMDSTDGGSFSIPDSEVGSNPATAPGGANNFDSDSDSNISIYDSLLNLFSFNIFNPFAGLFGLFTDPTGCVSIPHLASMLGTDQVEYCPWFSSTTRSILTPVLGLTGSIMLFGAFVRWLKSSSGNFMEDSGKGE